MRCSVMTRLNRTPVVVNLAKRVFVLLINYSYISRMFVKLTPFIQCHVIQPCGGKVKVISTPRDAGFLLNLC